MSEPEIYKKYFQEELNNKEAYYEVMKGLDSGKIPEIQNTFDRTLEAMSAPFEKFCKIMTDDMKTQILEGASFMPRSIFLWW